MFKRRNSYNRYLNPPKRNTKRILVLPMVLLGMGAMLYFLFFTQQSGETTPFSSPNPSKLSSRPDLSSLSDASQPESEKTVPAAVPVIQEPARMTSEICKGDTISGILGTYLTPPEILELGQVCEPVFPLSGIRPGQPYTLVLKNDNLTGFEYEIDANAKLLVSRDENGFSAVKQDIVYEIKREIVEGSIDSSLSLSLDKLGEGPGLAVMMEDILGWDVDFGKDIRQGDRFKILVEKRFRKEKPAGYGHILALDFQNRDRTFKAFRYTDAKDRTSYFDEKGQSMRKAFLKAPLSFTRISSGYSNRRFHPILKRWRPHHGVDYAAPIGTPIRTIGDGVVIAKAYDKAAGRYVKIRHPRGYETVYNHMSRFGKSIRKGKQVKQGEVIGYVGSSGYSTGPHLDFRVKRHGSYINPLNMKSPPTNPVPAQEMDRFREEASLLAQEIGTPFPENRIMKAQTEVDPTKG